MDLGGGADQHPVAGVHQERPVRAALVLQQAAEQGERGGGGEAVQGGPEVAPDHEVGALAAPDLVLDDGADDPGVLLVAEVEAAAAQLDRGVRQRGQHLGQRQRVLLLDGQRAQRGAVLAGREAALAQLGVRDQGQQVVPLAVGGDAVPDREFGERVVLGDGAEQQLDGVRREPGRAAVQQGEGGGAGRGEPGEQVGCGGGHDCGVPSGGWLRALPPPSGKAVTLDTDADGRPEGRPSIGL